MFRSGCGALAGETGGWDQLVPARAEMVYITRNTLSGQYHTPEFDSRCRTSRVAKFNSELYRLWRSNRLTSKVAFHGSYNTFHIRK